MGLLKEPFFALGVSARESSPLVAEQLALHHFFVNGCAIDRHKGAGNPGAVEMDGPGKKFLAHPAFSTDVDIGIRTSGNPFSH